MLRLVDQLAHALSLMPCRCITRWRKPDEDNSEDRELVTKCGRCVALERYQREQAEVEEVL